MTNLQSHLTYRLIRVHHVISDSQTIPIGKRDWVLPSWFLELRSFRPPDRYRKTMVLRRHPLQIRQTPYYRSLSQCIQIGHNLPSYTLIEMWFHQTSAPAR